MIPAGRTGGVWFRFSSREKEKFRNKSESKREIEDTNRYQCAMHNDHRSL